MLESSYENVAELGKSCTFVGGISCEFGGLQAKGLPQS